MIKGALPNPALFLLQYFKKTLITKGIELKNDVFVNLNEESLAQESLKPIYTHHSVNLSKIIKATNMKSINLYADAMHKMAGYIQTGDGSFEGGTIATLDFWENKNINTKGIFMEDGSGLSRFNAVSAKSLTHIVKYTLNNDRKKFFLNSLPIAGRTGTLKGISKNRIAAGRIYAKSGYIKNVRAYTGLINTYSEKKLVFSILINNHSKSFRELSKDIESIFDLLVRL
ncbi:MAG: D-alanyl-D-alanine carboxypeptidase/D-alanyl-D-alanine-endopeptidase, partial [Bacteroidota bacterium]